MEARNSQLRLEMARLRIENNPLKKIKLQEPLVKVSVLVRRGFFQEFAKVPNKSMVLAGYYAAHQGNVRANECMFELGYLKNQELIPSPGEPETEFEATFRSPLKILYELPLGGAKQGFEALPFSRKVLEAAEMRVTMNSLCELFPRARRKRQIMIVLELWLSNSTRELKIQLHPRQMQRLKLNLLLERWGDYRKGFSDLSQTQCHTSGRGDGLCRLGMKSL
jgi:hypothetical protein